MAEGKIKIGDRATAVQYCKKAIDKVNNDDGLANQVQRNYSLLGEQDTEQMCRQKLDSEPESFNANWMMYNLYRVKGDYNKAIQYLNAGLKAAGTNQERWLNCSLQKTDTLIMAFFKTSDKNYLNEALDIYESVLAKVPNNSYILNNVAYILAENDKDLDKAIGYAKRACEIKPDDPGYLDTYALVLYKNGKYPDGIQVARSAIQQYEAQRLPTPAEAYVHLAQCQEQIGELQQAREAYEQALDAGGENISESLKAQINTSIERIKTGKGSK